MAQVIERVASDLERLNERIQILERRISALEAQPEKSAVTTPASSESVDYTLQRPRPPATWGGFPGVEVPGGAVPVLGKAVMAIAGAYLLQAIAESGTTPKLPVSSPRSRTRPVDGLGRPHSPTNRFASITYGITSALTLSPPCGNPPCLVPRLPHGRTAAFVYRRWPIVEAQSAVIQTLLAALTHSPGLITQPTNSALTAALLAMAFASRRVSGPPSQLACGPSHPPISFGCSCTS
jgi:hypothetical protein